MPRTPRRSASKGPKRASLRRRVFWETYILLTIAVIGIVGAAWVLVWGSHRSSIQSLLQRDASVLSDRIEQSISRDREALASSTQTELFARIPSLRSVVEIDAAGTIVFRTGQPLMTDVLHQFRGARQSFAQGVLTNAGWTQTILGVPLHDDTMRIGVFDAAAVQAEALRTDTGRNETRTIVLQERGELVVLHDDSGTRFDLIRLPADRAEQTTPLVQAIGGNTSLIEAPDYAGVRSIAAYRTLPSLGWAVGVSIDRATAIAPILRITFQLWGVGLILISLLSLSALLLARRIVAPLEHITEKLDAFEARRGVFTRSVHTGDELEIVDRSAAALTERLSAVQDHLEDIVRERTEALRTQLAENRAILESIDYGLVVTDAEGQCRYINVAAQHLLGIADGTGMQTAGDACIRLIAKDGRPLERMQHPIFTVLATNTPFHPPVDPELSLRKPDGSEIAVQIRATPMMRGRTCLGVVTVLRDTTDERRVDRIKSEFISLVSHQLRTPLSSMRWYLEMLLAEEASNLTKEQRESLEEVATSNARMVHLVNGLLNVSRMEMGRLQVTSEVVDVATLLQSTSASFHLECRQKHMTIATDVRDLDAVVLHSDRGLLQLVLENLLSNAIKYSPEGSAVEVRVRGDAAENVLRIAVTDSGIGIPAEQRGMIGRRLFRGKNARLSSTDGNGLGLYISMIAAEAIGGTLTFESVEGKGTTFTLTLPVTRAKGEQGKK